METIAERYANDRLSDNTQINYCEQCRECVYWGKSRTPWDNKHNKSNCAQFPYPKAMKPVEVINNQAPCPKRKVDG